MFDVDKEKIKQTLIVNGEPTFKIDRLLEFYPSQLHKDMFDALNTWLESGSISDVQIERLTLNDVMKVRNCHFLIAVRDLDRLYDENLTGEKKTQWIEILKSPIHYE